jgi:hypothetical protein
LFQFYDKILGKPSPRSYSINMDLLGILQLDLSGLAARFTQEEVLQVIRSLPIDKASGPDCFTARFLQATWETIKADLMRAFDSSRLSCDQRGAHGSLA